VVDILIGVSALTSGGRNNILSVKTVIEVVIRSKPAHSNQLLSSKRDTTKPRLYKRSSLEKIRVIRSFLSQEIVSQRGEVFGF